MKDQQPKEVTMDDGCKGGFALIGDDLLQEILWRLPAKSFASAACVCCSWNRVCNRILSRPKLLSALSLNPRLEIAVNEALSKVLAEAIRPHFAIAYVGRKFSVRMTHKIIMEQLGSRIPVITCEAHGIIGADAFSDEFKEVMWGDHSVNSYNSSANINRGVLLIVGFVPGLKVRTIPLMQFRMVHPQVSMIDKFVTDIKDYTASVSGCTSLVGIIIFADQYCDMRLVLDKLDSALSKDTVIVGDGDSGCFLCSNGDDSTIFCAHQQIFWGKNAKEHTNQNLGGDAVALVFAKERENRHGAGEIQFSLALSTAVSPVGPTYNVRELDCKGPGCSTCTRLTARREGSLEKLDGERILQDIYHEVENDISSDKLYIGFVRQRKCFNGSEKGELISSLAFHEVIGADEDYLYVNGDGIKTGDLFQFYCPDPESALLSRNNVLEDHRALKRRGGYSKCGDANSGVGNDGDVEVCGGLIFSCFGRGGSFSRHPNVDSSTFTENFPGLAMAGKFCGGKIARRLIIARETPINCCLHVCSTLYFLMLYTPTKPLE